jgi:hypothetical protein
MKKLFLSLLTIAALAFYGCGGDKPVMEENNVPAGWMALDLTPHGKNITINVPDTSNGPLLIEEMGGAIRISVGKKFMIEVGEGEGNIQMKKDVDIKANDIYKFDAYIVEEPTALIWKWHLEGSEAECKMFCIVKVGEVNYEVKDVDGEIFSEEACKKMLEAAKSIKVKEVKKTEA